MHDKNAKEELQLVGVFLSASKPVAYLLVVTFMNRSERQARNPKDNVTSQVQDHQVLFMDTEPCDMSTSLYQQNKDKRRCNRAYFVQTLGRSIVTSISYSVLQ